MAAWTERSAFHTFVASTCVYINNQKQGTTLFDYTTLTVTNATSAFSFHGNVIKVERLNAICHYPLLLEEQRE